MSEVNQVLDTLFANGEVTLPTRTVKIKKVTLRTMKPITEFIGMVISDMKLNVDTLPSVDLKDPALILKLISKYYDDVMRITVEHCDVPLDDLLDMGMDESVLVVTSVIALNKDFFMKKVLPNLLSLTATKAV